MCVDSNQAWLVSANGLMKQEVIQTQAMRAERSKVVLNMRHRPTHKAQRAVYGTWMSVGTYCTSETYLGSCLVLRYLGAEDM